MLSNSLFTGAAKAGKVLGKLGSAIAAWGSIPINTGICYIMTYVGVEEPDPMPSK